MSAQITKEGLPTPLNETVDESLVINQGITPNNNNLSTPVN